MTETDAGSLSPGRAASNVAASVALTAAAQAHVAAHGLPVPAGNGLRLTESCLPGDIVTIMHDGRRHDFSVLRRRWIVEEAGTRLEVTLDHPARPRLHSR